MGMVGLRDVLVVTPAAASYHHHDTLIHSADHHHPIIPLLTATPCLLDDDPSRKSAGIQFWQQQQQQQHHNPNPNPNPNPSLPYLRKPVPMLDAATGMLSSAGAATCQDCGNQAKKDCTHRRCRTCCKSRGFDCSTHVKSTWVPAARRRERQQISAATVAAGTAAGSSASTSAPKKPRLISSQTTTTASHTSTSNTTPPRSFDTSSSHQDASFRDSLPGQVRAPAVFKCVRVTSIDDGEDEYAYQAMVRIGGHVFKGFLYDQGEDDGRGGAGGEQALLAATGDANPHGHGGIPNISELHLGGSGSARNGAAVASSSGMIPGATTPDMFGSGGGTGGLLGGTNYGNPIN